MSVYLSTSKKAKSIADTDAALSEHEEEKKIDHVEMFRLKLKRSLSTTLPGRLYTAFFMFLGVVSCVQYIYQTYLNPRLTENKLRLHDLAVLEILLAGLFIFDWFLCLFLADHKYIFFRSFFSMIDLLTIIPTAFTYGTVCPYPYELYNSYDRLIYVMNMLTTTRTLRILRIHRYLILVQDPVRIHNMNITILHFQLNKLTLMQYLLIAGI